MEGRLHDKFKIVSQEFDQNFEKIQHLLQKENKRNHMYIICVMLQL
jgi:hypothetical protein